MRLALLWRTVLALAACAPLLTAGTSPLATRTWNGAGADDNWSTTANWTLNAAPVAGDDLIFTGTTRLTPVNDIGAIALSTMNFTSGGFFVSGNPISAGIIHNNTGGSNTIAMPIQLTAASLPINVGASGTLTVSGAILDVAGGATGGLAKDGAGVLLLTGANTYEGTTDIQLGTVIAVSSTALGSTVNGTVVQSGTRLGLDGGVLIAGESLQLAGQLENVGSSNTWTGSITLMPVNGQIRASSGSLTLVGDLNGAGGLIKQGPGTVVLMVGNTYMGATTVAEGVLVVRSDAGLGSAGSGTLVLSGASLVLEAGVNYASAEAVTLTGPGSVPGAIRSESGTNSFAGPITLGGDSTSFSMSGSLTLSGGVNLNGFIGTFDGPSDTTVTGAVTGGGTLLKLGSGTLTLSGNSPAAPPLVILNGTLRVNANINAPVQVNGGALLEGTGITGSITSAGGTLSPGAGGPGILASSPLTLDSVTLFIAELDGTTVGSGYDRLNVQGTVNLGNATLAAVLGFVPAPGDAFTIISNVGADAVTGTFAGLPNGAAFLVNTTLLQIRYDGGDGNDVTLTVPTHTVQWSSAAQAGDETGTLTVTAQLNAVSGVDVTVPYTVSGTAASPADFAIAPSPIVITAGNLTASATITVVDDPDTESAETIIVTMGIPTNAAASGMLIHTATINANDPPPPPSDSSDDCGSTGIEGLLLAGLSAWVRRRGIQRK